MIDEKGENHVSANYLWKLQ